MTTVEKTITTIGETITTMYDDTQKKTSVWMSFLCPPRDYGVFPLYYIDVQRVPSVAIIHTILKGKE